MGELKNSHLLGKCSATDQQPGLLPSFEAGSGRSLNAQVGLETQIVLPQPPSTLGSQAFLSVLTFKKERSNLRSQRKPNN